jgi:Protein of unknown function (DUF2817)
MDVAHYFSSDRKAARGHFLSACRAFNLDVVPFYAPREVVASGEPIVEVARVGRPYAPTVIALTCGAWEDEGLCASGIFTTLLRNDFTRHLSRDMALVLIHAIAPAGLSGLGRGTPTVSEPEQQWSHKALAAAESRFVDYVQQSALPAASDGGPVIPWQARVLCEIADQFFHQAKRTVVVDLRTGPGPYGEADLLPCQIVHGDPLVDIDPLFGIKDNPDEAPAWGTPGNLAHGLIAGPVADQRRRARVRHLFDAVDPLRRHGHHLLSARRAVAREGMGTHHDHLPPASRRTAAEPAGGARGPARNLVEHRVADKSVCPHKSVKPVRGRQEAGCSSRDLILISECKVR